MADRQLAKEILSKGFAMQRLYAPVLDRGFQALPEFDEYTMGTIEHLLDATALTPDQILSKLTTPVAWVCGNQRAKTATSVIDMVAGQRLAEQSARKQSVESGLPSLNGTPKQVTWAEKIRELHAKKSPESKHLASQKSASWWIERRNEL